MKWSWRVGRFAGIVVNIHATFPLLIIWVMYSHYEATGSWAAAFRGLAFVLVLFLCVVLHEFGHALTARRYGIPTRDITLLPIGGVARLQKMPEDPRQELVVAAAGPAVNVAIAAVLFGVDVLWRGLGAVMDVRLIGGDFVAQLMWVNVILVGFNMLPAFPMDGGRVVRALLAMRMPYVQATQIAAGLGQGMAVLFGIVGIMLNPLLVLIALFVYLGAAGEANAAQVRVALEDVPVREAMVTDFETLVPADPLRRAVDLLLEGYQRDFPVLDEGRVVGVLCKSDLIASVEKLGPAALVADAMRREFRTLHPSDMLQGAVSLMQQSDCPVMLVVTGGGLVGLLSAENIGEFIMVQSALRGRRERFGRRV